MTERIAGVADQPAREGERVSIRTSEALTSLDGYQLEWRLEELHRTLFSRIPNLPPPSLINNLLIVINPDLQATAYVNELQPTAQVRLGKDVKAGDPVFVGDILDMESYDLGVEIPSDAAVVVVRSHGWRRALFYDFGSLLPDAVERLYDLGAVLAQQTLALITGKFGVRPRAAVIHQAIAELESLLASHNDEESSYQEILIKFPWLLSGQHTLIERHTKLDERNIPDFTGVRARDGARDLFEIKQPFLNCFRQDGEFSAAFHIARDQAERYLTFVRNNRDYLRSEKGLVFSNPHCFLLVGWQLSEKQAKRFHECEALNPSISLLSYEQLLRLARALQTLVERAGEAEAPK